MFRSLILAFATYSRIPMPQVKWDERSMRYSLCFFPFVGAVIGLCSAGCFYGLRALDFGESAVSAALTILPVVISGGIHMDGFLDTVDARRSYRSREEKLHILSDPHTGAFAVIYSMMYFLLCFGLFSEVTEGEIAVVAAGYVFSRILSAISVVTFPKAKKDGMAAAAADAARKNVRWILAGELVVWILAMLAYSPPYTGACIAAGGLVFAYYRIMSQRIFGGVTGDLAGWFLQVCEAALLLAVVIVGHVLP